ncbi:MAG: polysaccharide deacetylase family protein [Clostridia bacterium]|nr:polysaccharide deacetylase family protein [Clostridia bacterium]
MQKQIALSNVNQAGAAQSGICYLTFDDGPSDNTLRILDVLDSYGIKGTFFVIGTAKTSYMSQITSRGHAIGLHSANHNYSVIYKDVNSYLADIQQISDIVFAATGVRSNIFRFPGGSSNTVSAKYSSGIMTDLTARMPSLGYSYFDWNVDSGDARAARVPTQTIVNNVLNGARGKSSICVLMHDTSAKTTTVEALPAIIEGLHNMGFRFSALSANVFGYHQKVNN